MASLEHSTFVVIQTAFLGDIVLTSSFLRDLRTLYPKTKIVFVTTPVGAQALADNPWDIDILIYDKRGRDRGPAGLWRKAKELRAMHVARVYCLHRSTRSVMLAWGIGAPVRIGFAESALARFFTKRICRADYLYEAEKNRAALLAAETNTPTLAPPFPELFISQSDLTNARELLGAFPNKGFVAISPSSVWATKRWPAERFGEVAAFLWQTKKIPCVLLGSTDPEDDSCAQEVMARAYAILPETERKKALLNLSGKTSIGTLKAILGEAKLLLCNDSAPMHMAIARSTPVVAIFGSTTKELGFFPLAPEGRSAVVELEGLECRPCGAHGHRQCPQKHFRCMLDLSTRHVVEILLRQL